MVLCTRISCTLEWLWSFVRVFLSLVYPELLFVWLLPSHQACHEIDWLVLREPFFGGTYICWFNLVKTYLIDDYRNQLTIIFNVLFRVFIRSSCGPFVS